MAQVEQALNMDLTRSVVYAAQTGDVTAVRAWLAVGGSPNATWEIGGGTRWPLLAFVCTANAIATWKQAAS